MQMMKSPILMIRNWIIYEVPKALLGMFYSAKHKLAIQQMYLMLSMWGRFINLNGHLRHYIPYVTYTNFHNYKEIFYPYLFHHFIQWLYIFSLSRTGHYSLSILIVCAWFQDGLHLFPSKRITKAAKAAMFHNLLFIYRESQWVTL